MRPMRRSLLALALATALALAAPAAASAVVFEMGSGAPAATSSCPADPCFAATRVTGYVGGYDGRRAEPFWIGRSGRVIAFTVTLGKPTKDQVSFFTNRYGGPPQVQLTILRGGATRATRSFNTVVAQSGVYRVDRYLGSRPTFVLDMPLRVRRGNRVALTVPTWAPAFATGLAQTNWWRASRARRCKDPTQRAAQLTVGDMRRYACSYQGERLLYTATFVPDNPRTD